MSLKSAYETDPALEENGVWEEVAGDVSVLLARPGGANRAFQVAVDKHGKPFRRAIDTGNLSDEHAKKILRLAYADAVVKDWKGDDSLGACNPENVLAAFEAFPDFFIDVQQAAMNLDRYRVAARENDAKN